MAFNFNYALPVTECWLKAAPIAQTLRLGTASGLSGLDGTKLGAPPKKAAELRDFYLQLIKDAKQCIQDP